MNPLNDVIAAIATPVGEGGISIIRISGGDAIEIAGKLFRGKVRLEDAPTHTAHFGNIVDSGGAPLDEVVATVFRAPHSYTAENTVEISCHGGFYVSRKILSRILEMGARRADPGEFTKRAFLNGRIDLAQAEAVADLIRSRTDIAHQVSISQLQGRLSGAVREIRESLLSLSSVLELELDFIEEGLEFTDAKEIEYKIEKTIRQLQELQETYKYGKNYREGVKVVLTGRPNVGKSSILNALLNEDRAIVTEIPGTTRDVIEENITIEGMLFSLVDTAGLRKSSEVIEMEGIVRAKKEIRDADIIVLVVDANAAIDDDIELLKNFNTEYPDKDGIVIVVNKMDIVQKGALLVPDELKAYPVLFTSALKGSGIKELRKALFETSHHTQGTIPENSVVVTNSRHYECLEKARMDLGSALKDVRSKKSNDLITINLRSALDDLGEIIGSITSEDIINNIFSRFCIGK